MWWGPFGWSVALGLCRALLALGVASREPRYSFLLCFWLCCHVFCLFEDVVCVALFLSAVAGLFGHPLGLSFEGEDSVVLGSLLSRVWLAPVAAGGEASDGQFLCYLDTELTFERVRISSFSFYTY